MARRPVYINWGISSFFGWGVYGLNLALNWTNDPDLEPVGARPFSLDRLAVDPLVKPRLAGFHQRSQAFQARLEPFAKTSVTVDGVVLNCANETFQLETCVHDVKITGRPSAWVTFFETTQLTPQAVERANAYPMIVTGSTWNADVLRAHGLANVRTVIQGIDPTLFHPAPRREMFPDRFLVFSGGKIERRKGQDIVLAAFRKFAERRPDAYLITIWGNIWPKYAPSVSESGLTEPLTLTPEGAVDLAGWAAANGLGPQNFRDLGQVPNALLPTVLREMDVALFPNRAEGGTNLVAMECMACGVPTILSRNTGHIDLIEDENCYPLEQQGELAGLEAGIPGVAGWGESDVDEIVEALERVYIHRQEARARGARGAATLSQFSWARTAREMKGLVQELIAAPPATAPGSD